jgi:NAD+ synthase (glutamine-hydrolysing)
MRDGFIKVASGVPQVHLADVTANTISIKEIITKADSEKVNLLVLPELCITGYTCGDLFFNDTLISAARSSLLEIADFTNGKYPVVVLGLPLNHNGKLYNCAAVIHNGSILGVVPKTHLPNHSEFSEQRYFDCITDSVEGLYTIFKDECGVEISRDLIFVSDNFSFGVEICEDLFAPEPTNQKLALAGAQIIVNPAACNQTVGKAEYCKSLIKDSTTRLNCGYVLASSGIGESSTDTVYGGLAFIYEN